MSRKGENIYKRKDGRWEGRYIKGRLPDGKIRYGYVYAGSYREVRQKVIVLKAGASKESQIDPTESNHMLILSEVAEEWLMSKKSRVKESTYAKYRNSVAVYLQPFFEKVPLDTLTCAEVKKFRDELLARGGTRQTGLSEKTVADILALLKNILRYAEENYQLSICDISNLTVKQTKKEIRVFSRREEEKLCCYLYKERNLRNVGILLCLFTGIRIGELCALRWEDISMVESTIHIHRTMQRVQTSKDSAGKTKIIITSPKSDCSVRTIPIPKDLVEILENCQCSSGYFLTGENTVFIEPRSMQNHFKRVLKNCSLEDVNFHTLRHTFATRCVELGIDVKSLSEILGHSSVTITMNRYVHPSMEMKRESIERLFESFTVR